MFCGWLPLGFCVAQLLGIGFGLGLVIGLFSGSILDVVGRHYLILKVKVTVFSLPLRLSFLIDYVFGQFCPVEEIPE